MKFFGCFMSLFLSNLLGIFRPYVLQYSKDIPQNSSFNNKVFHEENIDNNSMGNIIQH